MNPIKSLVVGAAVLALGLVTTAQAAETRSSSALPSKAQRTAKSSLKRASADLGGETSAAVSPVAIGAVVLIGGGLVAVAAGSGNGNGNGNDSPGT